MVKPGSLGLPGYWVSPQQSPLRVHCPFSFAMPRDCCTYAPHTHTHTRISLNPTTPPQGLAGLYRATNSSRCFLQVMFILPAPSGPVGPPLMPHQFTGGAEQFDRCRRGFIYSKQPFTLDLMEGGYHLFSLSGARGASGSPPKGASQQE